jgi:putative tryptophan/tyrosine transport system substrate-binding protein
VVACGVITPDDRIALLRERIDKGDDMRVRGTSVLVLVAALLALGAALAVGCGGDDSPATEPETTATTAEETTETTVGEQGATDESYTVGITQIVSHPALDATVEGFKDAMAEEGFVEGENVTYDDQNAQGDMANAASIAQKFNADDVDLILAVATPTSQAAAKATSTIPIVFAAVTDPVEAGLVQDAEAPEANVTGVSDLLPLQPHLDLIQQLVPDIETLGLLYNAGEANSVALVEAEKELAADMGMQVVEATAASSAEVQQAAQSLVGRADAISVLTDNTIVSALESVVQIARDNQIPLIAGDTDSVQRGALAAYAFDYYDLGRQAGLMAAAILRGQSIQDTPVEYAQDLTLSMNEASAEAMGVTVPEELRADAEVF